MSTDYLVETLGRTIATKMLMSETTQEKPRPPIAARLRTARKALNLSQGDLAERVGMSQQGIGEIERGIVDRPKKLRELARAVQRTEDWLLGEDGPPTAAHSTTIRSADVAMPARDAMPNDVPVHGTAAGSLEGSFIFDGGEVDYVRRPPGIANARDVYAIFVEGASMEPEHPEGDLRFVNPRRPIRPGDSAVVQVKYQEFGRPQGFIAHFVRRDARRLVVKKLNPESTLEFEADHVVSVHKVLTMRELFGI